MKKLKPTSPGTRFVNRRSFNELTTNKPFKQLTTRLQSHGGRNNQGRITVRHQGGGVKRLYRLIDFKRDKYDVPGKVTTIEYDPYRSADIALITYRDGEKRYIIRPKDLKLHDEIISGLNNAPLDIGNCLPIKYIPLGTKLHCLELRPGKGAQLARSAGNCCVLVNQDRDPKYMLVSMSSGEIRKILNTCRATIGEVGNNTHKLVSLGKAGAKRFRGIRPTVRGTAMNPVDHPHGGGEGKNFGRLPKTPWGKPTKGYKTRNNKRTDKFIVKGRKRA